MQKGREKEGGIPIFPGGLTPHEEGGENHFQTVPEEEEDELSAGSRTRVTFDNSSKSILANCHVLPHEDFFYFRYFFFRGEINHFCEISRISLHSNKKTSLAITSPLAW